MNVEDFVSFNLSNSYKNVCINIVDFTDLIINLIPKIDKIDKIDLIPEKNLILTGLFAKIANTKIWVSKYITPSYFAFSDSEISLLDKEMKDWSNEIPLYLMSSTINKTSIQKYLELRTFW